MNVMGNKMLGVSNMVVCDVCKKNKAICDLYKKNKATRKIITYPTMSPVEYVAQFHGVDYSRTVNEYKRNNVEYDDICQQCRDIIDYVYRLYISTHKGNDL